MVVPVPADEVYVVFKCRMLRPQSKLVEFFVARGCDAKRVRRTLRDVRVDPQYPSVFPKTQKWNDLRRRTHDQVERFLLHNSKSFGVGVAAALAAAAPAPAAPAAPARSVAVVYSTVPRPDLLQRGYVHVETPLYRGRIFAYVSS